MAKKKGFIIDYSKIEKEIWNLAEPLCLECGAELIDVEYLLENGRWYLRIYIDREPPVDHLLCEQVSEKISLALDATDPIKQSYYLEVSSPGLERPLKRKSDFSRYAGHEIMVRLYALCNGSKEFRGVLLGLKDNAIILQTEGNEIALLLDHVAKAHLVAYL